MFLIRPGLLISVALEWAAVLRFTPFTKPLSDHSDYLDGLPRMKWLQSHRVSRAFWFEFMGHRKGQVRANFYCHFVERIFQPPPARPAAGYGVGGGGVAKPQRKLLIKCVHLSKQAFSSFQAVNTIRGALMDGKKLSTTNTVKYDGKRVFHSWLVWGRGGRRFHYTVPYQSCGMGCECCRINRYIVWLKNTYLKIIIIRIH